MSREASAKRLSAYSETYNVTVSNSTTSPPTTARSTCSSEEKIGTNFSHVYAFDYSFNDRYRSRSGSKQELD